VKKFLIYAIKPPNSINPERLEGFRRMILEKPPQGAFLRIGLTEERRRR
jgi:hypothetical protein